MRTGDRFVGGTTNWRTVLYADLTSGTLLTTAENIELFKALGVMMTPELKTRVVCMPLKVKKTGTNFDAANRANWGALAVTRGRLD
ncbi:hypothetical protein [Aromatoleum evansii]|uniref:hypothetical protein n=1 Tax=Aromatoleum evansii TaxID=59406 RepID=UPI001B7CF1DA|nr:hypothetical protein [Aromatoleum evansii]